MMRALDCVLRGHEVFIRVKDYLLLAALRVGMGRHNGRWWARDAETLSQTRVVPSQSELRQDCHHDEVTLRDGLKRCFQGRISLKDEAPG